jgi:hypothetical protein
VIFYKHWPKANSDEVGEAFVPDAMHPLLKFLSKVSQLFLLSYLIIVVDGLIII